MKHVYRITVAIANQEGQTVTDTSSVVASDIFEAAKAAKRYADCGCTVNSIICIDDEVRRK